MRIGTRGSPLALVQARMVRARLAGVLGIGEEAIELKTIRTTGDKIQDRPLAEEGGKGLFTKEIEEALLRGDIDLAVHSAKDMPTFLPTGLMLAACLEREDPRDVFVSRKAKSLADAAARRQPWHRRRRAGRRSPCARGAICVLRRCAATWRHGYASSTTAKSMLRSWRSPG